MISIALVALFGAAVMIALGAAALWCEKHPGKCGANDDGGQRP